MRRCSTALLWILPFILLANVERVASYELTSADYVSTFHSFADHQNGGTSNRLLRRYDEVEEERAIGGTIVSGLTTKLKDGASKLAEKLVSRNKYEVMVAAQLKLERIMDTSDLMQMIGQVKQFNSKHVLKKISVIGTLTTRYGDDALAKALVADESEALSIKVARQIQELRKEQLTRWQRDGNSADDVFKLLKIRGDGYNVFASRKLEVMDDYIKLVNANKKKADQTSLLSTLIKGFGGEEKLGELLQTAKKHSRTQAKAEELETSLISKWARERQSPANVFQWLKLHDDIDNAFAADNLLKFANYFENYNLKQSTRETPLIEFYRNSFGEANVAIKLISALDDPATSNAAKKLQTQGWKSVDDMLARLNINKDQGAETTSQKLDALAKFIALKGGERNLIKTLEQKFGSKRELALILNSASTTADATTLQRKQFATWIANNIRPESVLSSTFGKGYARATLEEKAIVSKFKAFYFQYIQ
ncbi:hypothetical protein PPTG_08782 [Phytophthora nicotianae INRA-310]|uniref:RxLR effector protein n=1 Tax=Phytophthora nicotianae (strain INRA-310) TaxID=761204 RepID=W2QIJ2_PHYN3|nr:hypothetical protein PPTG_08782 [Phytophthora nicotianae INRA-310]ETN12706.1 hypothetical protein PPTG_08782 [Phytophthora nicotianae INRA-310]